MKNFIMGVLVVIVIIAAVVLFKRLKGEDKQMTDDNQVDSSSLNVEAGLNVDSNGSSGETLPQ
jgi:uncharacterized membrane protein